MHWLEAKIAFQCEQAALITELIADIFDDLGTKGVVVDDPSLDPPEGWGRDAVARPTEPAVTGYLPANDLLETKRQLLELALKALSDKHRFAYTVAYQSIDEEDWAEAWKAFFWPQEITPKLVVKPTWRAYTPRADQTVIEIDPGMAFGTGTHPTTSLCMQLLERYIQPGIDILDIGTGSGILLITAAKLGAKRLTGIDLDPTAVEIARENLIRNHIPTHSFNLFNGNLMEPVQHMFDLVVANILADVIIELTDDVARVLKPGGILICSGIIEAFQSGVMDKMAACDIEIKEVLKQEDWVAVVGQRTI